MPKTKKLESRTVRRQYPALPNSQGKVQWMVEQGSTAHRSRTLSHSPDIAVLK